MTSEAPPAWLAVDPAEIPAELRALPHWVCWRAEWVPGRQAWTKIPYVAGTDRHASVTDSETWAGFDFALRAYQRGGYDGIGCVLTRDDGLTFVDLDHCVDSDGKGIEGWALAIVRELDSYTEVSPSGNGLRIVVRGSLPVAGRRSGKIELYSDGRYCTFTGARIPTAPTGVENRQAELDALYRRLFAATPESGWNAGGDDAALLERARAARNGEKFARLWAGDWSGYPSQSEADQALATMLVWWCGGNTARADRLFRTSGLFRPKWDTGRAGNTYGGITLDHAFAVYRATEATAGQAQPAGPISPNGSAGPAAQSQLAEPLAQPAWEPVWLPDLTDETPRPWLWEGMVSPGGITFLTGLWKVGKTTFLAHLLRVLESGGDFCGLPARPARVLVLSEEHRRHWIRRRDALQLGAHIAVVTHPFVQRADPAQWQAFVSYEAGQVRALGFDLVVFDSLPNLWPVTDENAAPVVQQALAPLGELTALDAAVLCLMHPSKGDQNEGRAIRGSGALGGWADILLELRRFDPDHLEDHRRTLTSFSRYDDLIPEIVLDYSPEDGYQALGGRASVRDHDRLEALLDCLPAGQPGITVEDALIYWPEGLPKLSRRSAFAYLESARLSGRVTRVGTGRKGDAFRFATAT